VKDEPRWIEKRAVLLLHEESLAQFGGPRGVRDEGLLDSALGRPVFKWRFGEARELADLAAAYGFGIAKNHPFVDGNKRAAFLALGLFLALNGRPLEADPVDAIRVMLALAAGEISEEELARWVAAHILAPGPR